MDDQTTPPELPPQVLDQFRHGHADGVRAVYRRYSGSVFTVAMSVLHDAGYAADAVQETFVRAWRAAGRYDASQAMAPWLYTIARRVALDMWRARRRSVFAPPVGQVAVPGPDLDAAWEAYHVRKAVNRLPRDERAVVWLQHFRQYSHAEIAVTLGIPIGTVKSRSHRAHGRLAGWLRGTTG
jgi:RNA polymerase sigma-70 factor (ECF subfamily)